MKPVSLAATLTLACFSQAACVANIEGPQCTVSGVQVLPGDKSEEQICRDFRERLALAMTERGDSETTGDLTIAIELDKRGSAAARVSQGERDFPTITVDVMDRPMNETDLARLADAVARVLADK